MRILIAPDKFKGSLDAQGVADSIAGGLRHILPDATIELVPVADGGEGTANVICQACKGEWITCDAHDALGRPIQARYGWLSDTARAVMEMSEAAGGRRSAPAERDPLRANTFGVGEMLLDATSRGAGDVVLGLGGSITNDGGFGLARALKFKFFDDQNVELVGPVPDLLRLGRIERRGSLPLPRIVAAVDVRNPLLGENGATLTFGPQKGATGDQLGLLENALMRLADIVARDLAVDYRWVAGSGAAGGLGFGLMSFCEGTIQSGFDLVSEMLDLEAAIQRAEVVITGEGTLDRQTNEGKAPAGVARLARKWGKRIFAIVGCQVDSPTADGVFDAVFPLAKPPIKREEAMSRTQELLEERGRELGRILISCS